MHPGIASERDDLPSSLIKSCFEGWSAVVDSAVTWGVSELVSAYSEIMRQCTQPYSLAPLKGTNTGEERKRIIGKWKNFESVTKG